VNNNRACELWLVRHGETFWNREGRIQGQRDVELSELGRQQAERLGDYLLKQKVKIDAVYASDLQRTYETAARIGQRYGLNVQPDGLLRERAYGKYEGLLREEMMKEFPNHTISQIASLGMPGWETDTQVQQRGLEAVKKIAAKHPGQRVLVVSHGGTIRLILAHFLKEQPAFIKNTSVSILRMAGGKGYVDAVNLTDHLR
jgi:broad specificity phosphatase PhoE